MDKASIVNNFAWQAISTSYCGPTNTRGSRIIVTAEAGRMIVDWNYSLDAYANHAAAAQAFANRWEWGGRWVGGGTREGYVFVCVSKE